MTCTLCGYPIPEGDCIEWLNVDEAAHPKCASDADAELDRWHADRESQEEV